MKKFSNSLKLVAVSTIGGIITLTIIHSNATGVSATGDKYTAVIQDYIPEQTESVQPSTVPDSTYNSISDTIVMQVLKDKPTMTTEESTNELLQAEIATTINSDTEQEKIVKETINPNTTIVSAESETVSLIPMTNGTEVQQIENIDNSSIESSIEINSMVADVASITDITQFSLPADTMVIEQTQPITQEETNIVVPTYTDIIYSGYDGNKISYGSLQEAQEHISVSVLSFEDAKNQAIQNKTFYSEWIDQIYFELNNYRISQGKLPLTLDDTLTTIAMHRAVESAYSDWNMTAIENGSSKRHIRPNFQKASSILTEYGISGNYGENYARWYYTPEEVMTGWKRSSGHNTNMLNEHFTKVGIGIAVDKDNAPYWIMVLL